MKAAEKRLFFELNVPDYKTGTCRCST